MELSIKDNERIEIMAKHYIIAALWADSEEGTHPRATKLSMKKAKADCILFCEMAGPELLREVQRRRVDGYGAHPDCGTVHPEFAALGHDFWLTRNWHGVGFWDRPELEADNLGADLTDICNKMGQPTYWFYRGWLYLN